mmetsp:Transcript_56217/g.142475  ORF Transcript_56217/g.142475 Transcript_56217/m.142475 type:complete len:80 (+) Transcript_56217:73-312(+)
MNSSRGHGCCDTQCNHVSNIKRPSVLRRVFLDIATSSRSLLPAWLKENFQNDKGSNAVRDAEKHQSSNVALEAANITQA